MIIPEKKCLNTLVNLSITPISTSLYILSVYVREARDFNLRQSAEL